MIKLRTNIDLYNLVVWPVLNTVPRKGEYVQIHPASDSYCESKKIPKRLEVVSVTYTLHGVIVELWYNETDYKLYTSSGHKLL